MGFKYCLYPIGYQGGWYDGKKMRTLEQIVTLAKEQGWNGIAISGKRPLSSVLDRTEKDWKKIKSLCDSHGLQIPCWETYSNFGGPTEESRESNLIWMREILKASAAMDIKFVKIFAAWTGIVVRDGRAWYEIEYDMKSGPYFRPLTIWNWIKEGIKEACKMADDYGITLGLQNHPPPFEFGYEECLSMVREINHDRLKMVLDISNMFGYSFFDRNVRNAPERVAKYIPQAVQACKSHLAHYTHIGGDQFIQKPDGTYAAVSWTSVGPAYNWELFAKELKKVGFDGWLTYENCGPNLVNHVYQGVDYVDERAKCALGYLKQISK